MNGISEGDSALTRFYSWELDATFYLLRALSWFGIVWDLRYPSQSILNAARVTGL